MSDRVWAGVDIGGTKTAVSLAARLPEILTRVEFPTLQERGPAYGIGRIQDTLKESLARTGTSPDALAGIGVSCGGPLDPVRGLIQSPPNIPTWVDVPIIQILGQKFGVPCRLENDANAGAVAEHRYGAGRGTQHMIFLTLGTGLGAGLILNGKLYRGASETAGEIGHVRLTRSGPVGYRKAGSVEGWASGGGMVQVAERVLAAGEKRGEASILRGTARRGEALSARVIAEAAEAGDPAARQIVRISATKLGEALAILIDLFNPECIVAGGLAMRMGDTLLGPARKVARREALGPAAAACRIVPAELGERIGDFAALCVAEGL
jgi:glucokinase